MLMSVSCSSYIEPVQIGAVMRAYGLGSIVARGSKVTNLQVGDTVEGLVGEKSVLWSS